MKHEFKCFIQTTLIGEFLTAKPSNHKRHQESYICKPLSVINYWVTVWNNNFLFDFFSSQDVMMMWVVECEKFVYFGTCFSCKVVIKSLSRPFNTQHTQNCSTCGIHFPSSHHDDQICLEKEAFDWRLYRVCNEWMRGSRLQSKTRVLL